MNPSTLKRSDVHSLLNSTPAETADYQLSFIPSSWRSPTAACTTSVSTPGKPKTKTNRKRIEDCHCQHRTQVLLLAFERDPMPPRAVKRLLARQLDMSVPQVQLWFQNRRAKARRAGLDLPLQRRKAFVFHHTQVFGQPSGGIHIVTRLIEEQGTPGLP